jgi:hypothetical protein
VLLDPLEQLNDILPINNGFLKSRFVTPSFVGRLAPAVLFSVGCGGFDAVFTVQLQACLMQTS